MTLGERNNNPLNIRHSKDRWQGIATTQTDKEFVQFQTMAYGYRAAWKTLQTYYKRLRERKKHYTVENIIRRWAPPQENDTNSYIRTVLALSGIGGQLDFLEGAFRSKGGKGFVCLNSARKDKEGNLLAFGALAYAHNCSVSLVILDISVPDDSVRT